MNPNKAPLGQRKMASQMSWNINQTRQPYTQSNWQGNNAQPKKTNWRGGASGRINSSRGRSIADTGSGHWISAGTLNNTLDIGNSGKSVGFFQSNLPSIQAINRGPNRGRGSASHRGASLGCGRGNLHRGGSIIVNYQPEQIETACRMRHSDLRMLESGDCPIDSADMTSKQMRGRKRIANEQESTSRPSFDMRLIDKSYSEPAEKKPAGSFITRMQACGRSNYKTPLSSQQPQPALAARCQPLLNAPSKPMPLFGMHGSQRSAPQNAPDPAQGFAQLGRMLGMEKPPSQTSSSYPPHSNKYGAIDSQMNRNYSNYNMANVEPLIMHRQHQDDYSLQEIEQIGGRTKPPDLMKMSLARFEQGGVQQYNNVPPPRQFEETYDSSRSYNQPSSIAWNKLKGNPGRAPVSILSDSFLPVAAKERFTAPQSSAEYGQPKSYVQSKERLYQQPYGAPPPKNDADYQEQLTQMGFRDARAPEKLTPAFGCIDNNWTTQQSKKGEKIENRDLTSDNSTGNRIIQSDIKSSTKALIALINTPKPKNESWRTMATDSKSSETGFNFDY